MPITQEAKTSLCKFFPSIKEWEGYEVEPEPPQYYPITSFVISELASDALKLKKHLFASLEQDGHQTVAHISDLEIYGYGKEEYEALEDLRNSIVDLYYDLKEKKLGKHLKKIWKYLDSAIEEK